MGWKSAFAYDRPADIYREHARLSTYRNNGRRLFDIGRHGAISNPDYDALEPFCWGDSPFADGHFPTGDGRARLVPVRQIELADPSSIGRSPSPPADTALRARSQAHTSELHSHIRLSY